MLLFNKANNFDEDDDTSKVKFNFGKLDDKIPLIVGIISVVLILTGIVMYNIYNVQYYLEINGEDNITIYLNHEYSEFGFNAYDSKGNDLTGDVIVDSNLNINKIGNYQISYTIGDVTKVRYVNVIEGGKTELKLKGESTVYLLAGSSYIESGYEAIDTVDGDITRKVIANNNINISKPGEYSITYFTVNSAGVYTFAVRKVIVFDINIKLSLSSDKYAKSVDIIVNVDDNYFDYLLLPDNNKVSSKNYKYRFSSNGEYKFITYNKYGYSKEASITVNNIDSGITSASCSGTYKSNMTTINVKASASSGINRYVINGVSYAIPNISISGTYNSSINLTVYDNLNNSKSIKCNIVNNDGNNNGNNDGAYITSISNNGAFVTIKTNSNNSTISGYYFSYSNKRPSKSGGYLATNRNQIEVVRLPGTTYVWVEDNKGNINGPKTINLPISVMTITMGSNKYYVLNQRISTFLNNNGSSIDEVDKLIARSVRAAGLNTKVGAATAGFALNIIMAQKFGIKLPYKYGTQHLAIGINSAWGMATSSGTYGFDCDGMVNWSYINAGIGVKSNYLNTNTNYYLQCFNRDCSYRKSAIEIGDILAKKGHVRIVIGKDGDKIIVAEGYGTNVGVVINYHDNPSQYVVIDGKYLIDNYTLVSSSDYPSGF